MAKVLDNFKRTTISLRNNEYEVLRYIAYKNKTSVAGVIRELINELIEEQTDIQDGMKALQDQNGSLDWLTFKKEKLGL
jgi:predicted DNA-binding protein